jgi:hypothetical protein
MPHLQECMKLAMSGKTAAGILGLCLLGAGCGSIDTRLTVEQMTNARVAVEAAESADAKTFSPDNLRHAQDALAIANDAYSNREFERAFSFSKKATMYARVAKSQTDQKRAETRLEGARDQLTALRKQAEEAMQAQPASAADSGTARTGSVGNTFNAVTAP